MLTGCHGCLPLEQLKHDMMMPLEKLVQTPDAYYEILVDQSLNI